MPDDPVAQLRSEVAALRESIHLLGIHDERVDGKLDHLEQGLSRMVSLDRYLVVEKVVYGLVSLVLVSFMGALIALVIR